MCQPRFRPLQTEGKLEWCPNCGWETPESLAVVPPAPKAEVDKWVLAEALDEFDASCDLCDYKGLKEQHLRIHMAKAHSIGGNYTYRPGAKRRDEPGDVPCPHCDKMLASPHGLKTHLARTHQIWGESRRAKWHIALRQEIAAMRNQALESSTTG